MPEYDDFNDNNTASSTSGLDSILDVDTESAVEPSAVDEGVYKLRITGFRLDKLGNVERTSEKGYRYIIVTLDIPSEPTSKGFSKMLGLPNPDMDSKQLNAVNWEMQCFKDCFGILKGDSYRTMIKKEGWGLLKKVSSEKYGLQNEIDKFVTGAPDFK